MTVSIIDTQHSEDATCFREQHLFTASATCLSSMPAPPCDTKQNLFKLGDLLQRLVQYKETKFMGGGGGKKKKMGDAKD